MSQNSGPGAPGRTSMGAAAPRSRTDAVRDKAAGAMSAQQRKAAGQLRSVADDLQEMAANGGAPVQAADLARQAAGRLSAAASWLDERNPGDLMTGIRALARPPMLGASGMIGQLAVARGPLAREGQVVVQGELWRAVAEGESVADGAPVRVVGIEGLTLRVVKAGEGGAPP